MRPNPGLAVTAEASVQTIGNAVSQVRPSQAAIFPFTRFFIHLAAAVCALVAWPVFAVGANSLDDCDQADLKLYFSLAVMAEQAYDESQSGLEQTPSGCVALIRKDADGNLVIAFRGSMLGDRKPKHRFSNLGGANIRRNYRDWVATNLKQATGFLPRQYVEAASLVEGHVRNHPTDKQVYITGHSKGGGAAAYAYVAVRLSPTLSTDQVRRMRCITFNAAVVKERNWRRLFRRLSPNADIAEREPAAGSIEAVVMAEDPVSRIGASEERQYVKRISITPAADLTPNEQHGIHVVLNEIRRRLSAQSQ